MCIILYSYWKTILKWTTSKVLWSSIYSFLHIVVFVTIYICTVNLFLLFDNTTGMTHLKRHTAF